MNYGCRYYDNLMSISLMTDEMMALLPAAPLKKKKIGNNFGPDGCRPGQIGISEPAPEGSTIAVLDWEISIKPKARLNLYRPFIRRSNGARWRG
jgi:hypothetical protein